MFARVASDQFRVGSKNGSKLFVMPDAWVAIAACDGTLWSAGRTAHGFVVVLDHSPLVPACTFYQHLEALFVPITAAPKPGAHTASPIRVKAGDPLGVIGASPTDKEGLKHLHFELWLGGPSDAIDPAPLMKGWEVLNPAQVIAARNARRGDPDLVQVVAHERRYPGTALRPPR